MPNQNSGDGRGSLRLGDLGGWTTIQTKQGEVCVLVFGGIDAPEQKNMVCVMMLCCTVTDDVLQNVALNKRSYQSSTYTTDQFGTYGASLANDGTVNSCVRSQSETNPWWAVDIGVETLVAQVNLVNRADAAGIFTLFTSAVA